MGAKSTHFAISKMAGSRKLGTCHKEVVPPNEFWFSFGFPFHQPKSRCPQRLIWFGSQVHLRRERPQPLGVGQRRGRRALPGVQLHFGMSHLRVLPHVPQPKRHAHVTFRPFEHHFLEASEFPPRETRERKSGGFSCAQISSKGPLNPKGNWVPT